MITLVTHLSLRFNYVRTVKSAFCPAKPFPNKLDWFSEVLCSGGGAVGHFWSKESNYRFICILNWNSAHQLSDKFAKYFPPKKKCIWFVRGNLPFKLLRHFETPYCAHIFICNFGCTGSCTELPGCKCSKLFLLSCHLEHYHGPQRQIGCFACSWPWTEEIVNTNDIFRKSLRIFTPTHLGPCNLFQVRQLHLVQRQLTAQLNSDDRQVRSWVLPHIWQWKSDWKDWTWLERSPQKDIHSKSLTNWRSLLSSPAKNCGKVRKMSNWCLLKLRTIIEYDWQTIDSAFSKQWNWMGSTSWA